MRSLEWSTCRMLFNLLMGSLPAVVPGSLLATKLSSRLLQTSLALVCY